MNLRDLESNQKQNSGRFKKGERHSPATEFKKGQHWREYRSFRDKEWLIDNYITKQRSAGEIAIEFNVTDAAIRFWMKKHNIKLRNVSEARKIKHWGASGDKNGMFGKFGKENPNYIDGSSPFRQKIYSRCGWKEIVRNIYKRDSYKCLICGSEHTTKNKLNAHHIKKWAGNPESRMDMNNIITLCSDCHRWVHSKENKQNEFLSY